ncbi:hypothetical protein LDVICp065 [lymphocystis disease virus-China]|uniref:Uncharacterized protein n=2 Tax=Lymphocystis disease virus 2 TaxID=159183 RepID=A0A6F8X1K3_9VIRU|nr:hypothetical protein LDVICp065 [lymphocystis disease virus-China]AAU10911.1 hypothetical protein [lymphocystis disease virus-China]BCB67450.1 hypothetical protein [Lymphocystis disease virus 2]
MFLGFIYYNQTILTLFTIAGIYIEKISFPSDLNLINDNKTFSTLILIDVRSDCNFYVAKKYNLIQFNPYQYDIDKLIYSDNTQYTETFQSTDPRIILSKILYYLDAVNGCSICLITTIASLLATFLIIICAALTSILIIKYFYIKHHAALPEASIIVLSDLPPIYEV